MTDQNEKSHPPTELSVLDYFKALLKPWSGELPQIPELTESPTELIYGELSSERDTLSLASESIQIPWRTLIALWTAMAAQITLQPAIHSGAVGAVLYLAAVGFAIWAVRRGELNLAAPRPMLPLEEDDDFSVILWPLISGLLEKARQAAGH